MEVLIAKMQRTMCLQSRSSVTGHSNRGRTGHKDCEMQMNYLFTSNLKAYMNYTSFLTIILFHFNKCIDVFQVLFMSIHYVQFLNPDHFTNFNVW